MAPMQKRTKNVKKRIIVFLLVVKFLSAICIFEPLLHKKGVQKCIIKKIVNAFDVNKNYKYFLFLK
jgi:hypothetical protein